jgi:type II secretory pathway component PulF
MSTTDHTPLNLSAATAEAVIERAASVSAAGMPLAAGLRGAAMDADSRALRRALLGIAGELDRGRSLDDCLASSCRVPPHLAGLVAAAQKSGDFGPLVAEWLENRRSARERWRGVISALAYPAISVAIAVAVFLFFSLEVVPIFGRMFEEFGLKLPVHTHMLLWASTAGSKIVLAVLLAGTIGLAATRLLAGRSGWSLLVTCLPIVGLPWHWTGVAEMLRLLSLLVEQQIALPEALRLTAAGVSDAYIASQCRVLAGRVERGTSLTLALIQLRSVPLSIVPLVYWGERHNLLADGLRSAAEMIEGRLSFHTDLLMQIIPPILFAFVGALSVSMVIGLFLPLISFMQGLM